MSGSFGSPFRKGKDREGGLGARPHVRPGSKPPLRVLATTLWEYPSQHYDAFVNEQGEVVKSKFGGRSGGSGGAMQGHKEYVGASPSWVIWQCLMRYTREGDSVLDPMCGSGTTLDVCTDVGRKGIGFDLAPTRPDIQQGDARVIKLPDASVDFVFIDPPYSTHVDYSDDPRCIGKLDASAEPLKKVEHYYDAMDKVIAEIHRVLKPKRYMGLYVSDSFRKQKGTVGGVFMPIGFELFAMMQKRMRAIDIISVVRHNQKLDKGNWRKAAEEGNFFLRGFNYLFLMRKD